MNTVVLTIKTDNKTKKELQSFAGELGVTTTAIVNMLVKDLLRTRKIDISLDLEPTPYLVDLMKQAEKEYAEGDYIRTTSKKHAIDVLDGLMSK